MQSTAQTQYGTPPTRPLDKYAPRPKSRGFIVGQTRSGKSTLAAALLRAYRRLYPMHVIYVIDPKARFVPVEGDGAELFPEGIEPRNFGRRDGVPIDAEHLRRLHVPAAPYASFVVHEQETAVKLFHWLYDHATVQRPTLLYLDESFDIQKASRATPSLRRLIQMGGEAGVGTLIINQRPAWIDATFITEANQLYVGRLIRPDDRKTMLENATVLEVGKKLARPLPRYTFLYLDQENERMATIRLRME